MGVLPVENVMAVVLELFSEAYEGAAKPYTWFVDNRPDSGLLKSLESLTSTIASQPPYPGGTPIAAHVEHLRWSLAIANEFVRGGHPELNWQQSWTVSAVDQPSWERLQADLRREFVTLRQALTANTDQIKPEFLPGIMALVPHAAYHLGAIRQMSRTIESRG